MTETLQIKIIKDADRIILLPEGSKVATTVLSSLWFGFEDANLRLKRKNATEDCLIHLSWTGGMGESRYFSNLAYIFGDRAYPRNPALSGDLYFHGRNLSPADYLSVDFNNSGGSNTLVSSMAHSYKTLKLSLRQRGLTYSAPPMADGTPVIDLEVYRKDYLPYFRNQSHPNISDTQIMQWTPLP